MSGDPSRQLGDCRHCREVGGLFAAYLLARAGDARDDDVVRIAHLIYVKTGWMSAETSERLLVMTATQEMSRHA